MRNLKSETASRSKAFTLIELIVVMAIIAMLSGILLAVLLKARARGKDIVRQSNQRQMDIKEKLDAEDRD